MMKSKEQMLVDAMMSEPKVDITESQDRKFKNALANKINQQVSKEYEVEIKSAELLENGSLGSIVTKLKILNEELKDANVTVQNRIEVVKAEIEENYQEILSKFYKRGGMRGNTTEAMILEERNQALANVLEHEDVKPLVDNYKRLELEEKASKYALQSYFDKNKKVIMEEMQKKKDEEMRESIRTSGILDMIE